MIKTGTCHFPTLRDAVAYYRDLEDDPRAAVEQKLKEGAIKLGPPRVGSDQRLVIEGHRYFVVEDKEL